MTEIDWYLGVGVLLAGLALGFGLALVMRREAKAKAKAGRSQAASPPAKDPELEALRAREAQLLTQLRALADGESTADPISERRELEREAASVMRQIDRHTGGTTTAPNASTPGSDAASSAPAARHPRSTDNGMSDQWIGALKGGSFVAVAFLLYLGLQSYSQPRSEGMSITGNEMVNAPAPGGRQQARPAPGAQGESREDAAARALAPTPSPELDAARARVQANPNSREAAVELGWALVDANGWIEVHRMAEALLSQSPDDPDGLTLAATVRLAMGQTEAALTRLNKALEVEPGHARATYIKARLAEAGPPPTAGQPPGHPPAHPPAHPPSDAPAHPGAAAAGAAGAAAPGAGGSSAGTAGGPAGQITGTVRLAASTKAPPGAVLFIIARQPGVTRGPPVASAKVAASTFPATFSLGPANLMMGGTFPAAVSLSARLDVDGNAMTRDAGDLVGSVTGQVAAGSQGVVIELSPSQP